MRSDGKTREELTFSLRPVASRAVFRRFVRLRSISPIRVPLSSACHVGKQITWYFNYCSSSESINFMFMLKLSSLLWWTLTSWFIDPQSMWFLIFTLICLILLSLSPQDADIIPLRGSEYKAVEFMVVSYSCHFVISGYKFCDCLNCTLRQLLQFISFCSQRKTSTWIMVRKKIDASYESIWVEHEMVEYKMVRVWNDQISYTIFKEIILTSSVLLISDGCCQSSAEIVFVLPQDMYPFKSSF